MSKMLAEDAMRYFQQEGAYPGVKYLEETDTFLYRGVEFNYFQSGITFDGPNCYILTHKGNFGIWLYNYGDQDERWKEYLYRANPPPLEFHDHRNWFQILFGL